MRDLSDRQVRKCDVLAHSTVTVNTAVKLAMHRFPV